MQLVSPGKMIGMIRRNRRPRSGFSPSSIAWQLWVDEVSGYDKDDGGGGFTPVTANNDTVIRWRDKSGNARHLTKGLLSNGMTYKAGAIPYLAMVGASSQYLQNTDVPRSQPSTSIVVASITTGFTADNAILGSNTANNFLVLSQTGTFNWPGMFTGGVLSPASDSPFDTFIAIGSVWNGLTSKLYQSAKTPITGPAGLLASDGITVGVTTADNNDRLFTGKVQALWLYDGVLPQETFENMFDYIAARYGVSIAA